MAGYCSQNKRDEEISSSSMKHKKNKIGLLEYERSATKFENEHLAPALRRRRDLGSLRELKPFHQTGSIDFSSNDYLGLARSQEQNDIVEKAYHQHKVEMALSSPRLGPLLGSTGSRLLTGDSNYANELENRLAKYHRRSAAILCNSGYDANLSVLSCLTLNAVVLMDELSHNSIQMGLRLSKGCTVKSFRHNDLMDLKRLLEHYQKLKNAVPRPVLVVVESVYSMDGDLAPLREILDLSLEYGACVIVDEAHGLGVFGDKGMGVLERDGLEEHGGLLCSIHTFGKAAGCHGAVVCGSSAVKSFLLNYGRPIIYSTSLPIHSLITISSAYESMRGASGVKRRDLVRDRVQYFRHGICRIMQNTNGSTISLVESISPIQALIIPGNTNCVEFCGILWDLSEHRIRLYPIRSPTVAKGEERVRIIVHAHNLIPEIDYLLLLIQSTLVKMGLLSLQISHAKL